MIRIKIISTVVVILSLFMSSCYTEEHFTLPGPYGDDTVIPDTMPFPFDKTRQAGIYLVKNGVVDFSRINLKGYSDFHPEMGDSVSWNQGDGFYGSEQHWNFYPVDNTDHYGKDANSYKYVNFVAKPFLENGVGKNWYFYARMSLTYLAGTAPYFWFGGGEGGTIFAKRHVAGFDGGAGFGGNPVFFANVSGTLIQPSGWPICTEIFAPDDFFDFELVYVDGFVYVRINGTVIWYYNVPKNSYGFPMYFVPWRNSVKLYDVYIEGDYKELDVVAYQHEKDEANKEYTTVQVPSLTKAKNGDVLLFAQGHQNIMQLTNVEAYAKRRSNASAIVMKSSQDGGDHWGKLKTLVSCTDGSVNIKPVSVTDKNGTIHLFYTKDNSRYLRGATGLMGEPFSIYRISSSDNGNSWTTPNEITTALQGEYSQSTISGHGVCMKNSGRLVIPTYCIKSGQQRIAILSSGDNGATWSCSEPILDNTAPVNAVGSANLVELTNDTLICVMGLGNTATQQYRKVAYSVDGGVTWSATSALNNLKIGGTTGFRFQGTSVSRASGEWIHITPFQQHTSFSGEDNIIHPNNLIFPEGVNMVTSKNGGKSWSTPQSLFTLQTHSGYYFLSGFMDAVMVDDNTVLCVTEGGVKTPIEGLVSFKKSF